MPASRHTTTDDTREAVDRFMADLSHPFKDGIQALREIVAAADPSIAEGVKWKSPSFRTTDYFATTHLRAKRGAGLILHLGAKVRDLPEGGVIVSDPAGLLKWLAKDRALIEFATLDNVRERRDALQALVRAWIAHV